MTNIGALVRDPAAFYADHAADFDAARARDLTEKHWLKAFADLLPAGGHVLDLGCGMGEPIAAWFLACGHAVTGVDASAPLVDLARARLPQGEWIHADMRGLDLGRRFDGILAWDSFFHLAGEAQRAAIATFAAHARPGAPLIFTSGTQRGEVANSCFGEPLFHASLDTVDYRTLLAEQGFTVVRHVERDASCGGRTIWLARMA